MVGIEIVWLLGYSERGTRVIQIFLWSWLKLTLNPEKILEKYFRLTEVSPTALL